MDLTRKYLILKTSTNWFLTHFQATLQISTKVPGLFIISSSEPPGNSINSSKLPMRISKGNIWDLGILSRYQREVFGTGVSGSGLQSQEVLRNWNKVFSGMGFLFPEFPSLKVFLEFWLIKVTANCYKASSKITFLCLIEIIFELLFFKINLLLLSNQPNCFPLEKISFYPL